VRLVLGHEMIIGPWVAERVPHMALRAGDFAAFGVVDDAGVIRGGALFHTYQPSYRTIEITFALESARWLTRQIILGIMAYPFDQLHCGRVTAATPKTSASARRFLETFGFRREGSHPKAFGDFGDAISYGLLEEHWRSSRFGPGRGLNGKVHAFPAAGA
jgi:RimJ/RimL family protein N-acetyltransferase